MAEKCVLAKRKDPSGNANCFVLKFMNSLGGKVYVWFPKTIKTKKANPSIWPQGGSWDISS